MISVDAIISVNAPNRLRQIMNTAEKSALIEEILMRAAEQVGDITAPAMDAYYRRYPEVKAAFEAHGLGKRTQLEGQMIENALHCLMHWFESPGEIEILLIGSVLHHNDTLHVSTDWYGDLIETTAEIIACLRSSPPTFGPTTSTLRISTVFPGKAAVSFSMSRRRPFNCAH